MGTWCTEGVKRIQAEHRREEADKERRACNQRKREYEDECEKKGICPTCKRKIAKKKAK